MVQLAWPSGGRPLFYRTGLRILCHHGSHRIRKFQQIGVHFNRNHRAGCGKVDVASDVLLLLHNIDNEGKVLQPYEPGNLLCDHLTCEAVIEGSVKLNGDIAR